MPKFPAHLSLSPSTRCLQLLLFETPAGFALFKVLDEGKMQDVDVRTWAHPVAPRAVSCHCGWPAFRPLLEAAGGAASPRGDLGCAGTLCCRVAGSPGGAFCSSANPPSAASARLGRFSICCAYTLPALPFRDDRTFRQRSPRRVGRRR